MHYGKQKREKKGLESLFKEIMGENFLNHEAVRTSIKITQRYSITNFSKIKDKYRILKTPKEKQLVTYKILQTRKE